MCYSPCNCCCCTSPYYANPMYPPNIPVQTQTNLNINNTAGGPPLPANDETFNTGLDFCNCQQCCDFRNCCNCSGFCYGCNVGRNSIPYLNSSYGPVYEYYQNGCCRSCFAAQFSGSSCLGSLFPCWLNTLYVVDQGSITQMQIIKNNNENVTVIPTQAYVNNTPIPFYKPQIITVRTGQTTVQPLIHPIIKQNRQIIPQIIPQSVPLNSPISTPIRTGLYSNTLNVQNLGTINIISPRNFI